MYDRTRTRRQPMVGSAALIAPSCAGCADGRTGAPVSSASPADDGTETPSRRPATGTSTETATTELTAAATPAHRDATFETVAGQPLVGTLYDGAARGQGLFESPHRDDLRRRIDQLLRTACSPSNS